MSDTEPEPRAEPGISGTGPDLRMLAINRLRRQQAFKTHLLVYVLVNLLLIGVWAFGAKASGDWQFWPIFSLLGWGIGIGMHGWSAYRDDQLSEERIRREMQRLEGSS